MLNQYEVPTYLVDELPEMAENLKKISPTSNIIKSIQCLSDFTKANVLQHDFLLVEKCFLIAEDIYSKGNKIVKDTIENVFVYSFSSLLNLYDRDQREELQCLMPFCIYTAYTQQILKSGI